MSRDLDASMVTALQQQVIRPVLIIRLDFETDPILGWTGPGTFLPVGSGDSALDGQTFDPFAPIFSMTNVQEDQGIGGALQLSLAGHDLDEELLLQVVNDKRAWRNRKAWVWLGLLNADEKSVVNYPVRIKTGVMSQILISRTGDEANVSLTIDRDLQRRKGDRYLWTNHARIWPGDEWSTFIMKLANKPTGLEFFDVNSRAFIQVGSTNGGFIFID